MSQISITSHGVTGAVWAAAAATAGGGGGLEKMLTESPHFATGAKRERERERKAGTVN